MLPAFFAQAMRAPNRQSAFRRAVAVHVALAASAAAAALVTGAPVGPVLGHVLLVAGIVEGAALVGWRLTQLPKSQALEFLLVSPLNPRPVFRAEAAIGLARLALVQFAGLPVLTLLLYTGALVPTDLPPLLALPFLYGTFTGLGLTAWSYEPRGLRRFGEVLTLVGVVLYLAVGILAVEKLGDWVALLPAGLGERVFASYKFLHTHNPFAALHYWLSPGAGLETALARIGWAAGVAAFLSAVFLVRSAGRMQAHFQERHYRSVDSGRPADLAGIGDRPLSWWAVRRVMEYSGRLNIWLAGGFGLLYACYTVAGDGWPVWLSRQVFVIVDSTGGIPAVATGLVLLAAVPAAFQYGLWDASSSDRCRRLELLLLTELEGRDYWLAAAAAAWRRGRGYFVVALTLWGAACYSGQATLGQVTAAVTAAVILWGTWFALGFRAFASGMQANGLGSVLTLGLPLAVFVLVKIGRPDLAELLPPGCVYGALIGQPGVTWAAGTGAAGAVALVVARTSVRRCEADLRAWYSLNTGRKDLD